MGWGILSPPGTEFGPCKGECSHTDCARTRSDAATLCAYCSEPIGYGNKFYDLTVEGENRMAHAVCVWKNEEERRKG